MSYEGYTEYKCACGKVDSADVYMDEPTKCECGKPFVMRREVDQTNIPTHYGDWMETESQPQFGDYVRKGYNMPAPTTDSFCDSVLGQPGPTGYEPLRAVLDAAYNHAATGKGKERHAGARPFVDQPMMSITRHVGHGFPLGQVMKKAQEAGGMIERGELKAAEAECLGAINYLAGVILWMRERA